MVYVHTCCIFSSDHMSIKELLKCVSQHIVCVKLKPGAWDGIFCELVPRYELRTFTPLPAEPLKITVQASVNKKEYTCYRLLCDMCLITWLKHNLITFAYFICLMLFNATLNNISVISWWSVLLVGETGGPGENHRPVASQ